MIEPVTINSPEIAWEKGYIFQLSPEDKAMAAERLQTADQKWGYDGENEHPSLNHYGHNDYVFVADLVQHVCNIHRLIYFDPDKQAWIRGCSPIPYLHFEFTEQGVWKKDKDGHLLKDADGNGIPDDTKLNMGVRPPACNGTHKLVLNYYWLGQYLKFLKTVFDDNEELTVSLPDADTDKRHWEPSYGTKEDILKLAKDIQKAGLFKQAESLRVYAASVLDHTRIQIPSLTFLREGGEQKHIGWSFFDDSRNVLTMEMKKGIYNTSGFARLFRERNALIADILIASLEMMIAHEVAHVARGHWNLRVKEPDVSTRRNVMMNCEIHADWTAMKWLLNELLYDTVDGNPHSRVLAYTKNRLLYLWSVRIFAAYLSLSWGYREDERVWTTQTVDQFRENKSATHPIYPFRLACVLNHAQEHLNHMGRTCEAEKHTLYTADGSKLNRTFVQEVWNNSLNMIHSFEVGIQTSWGEDTRTTLQKLNDSLYVEQRSVEGDIHKIPFMIVCQEKARAELAEIEQEWPEIKEHLKRCGMYYPLDAS